MQPIDVLRMHNASMAPGGIDIYDLSVDGYADFPSNASASYSLNSSGAGAGIGSSSAADAGTNANWTWLLSGLNSSYQVRATLISGTLSSGTTGSWLTLNTTRTWSVTTGTFKSATLTIEVRRISDGVICDTATVTLTASV